MEEAAALVAAAERNDADAVERIQRAARGDDDALCDALASHLRTELEREAPPPPLDNANDFPALPTTKKKRVRATLVTATVPPAPPVATPVKRPSAAASTDASAALDQCLRVMSEAEVHSPCSPYPHLPHLPSASG